MEKLETTHIGYATKIWLLAAALSPILYVVYETVITITTLTLDDIFGTFDESYILVLVILVGALVSIPNYLLLRLGTKFIFKKHKDILERRFWTQILVVVLWSLIFAILGCRSIVDFLTDFPVFYLISLTLGVWFFDVSDNQFEEEGIEAVLDDEGLQNEELP